jgi:hypothetical protein
MEMSGRYIYLVKRTDGIDYDEYDAFVVRSFDPEDAVVVCDDLCFKPESTTVKFIAESPGEREIILGSFNAG